MTTKAHQRQVTATISRVYADKLERIAKARGLSLHALACKVLTTVAQKTAVPPPGSEPEPPPQDDMTETVVVEILLPLAQRLVSAARQMRDDLDRPLPPTVLARELLIHECVAPTNIVQQMNEQVDPAYVDTVPFTAKTVTRVGRVWHLLRVKCTLDTRNAIFAAAQEHDETVANLVRRILHDHLPELPQ